MSTPKRELRPRVDGEVFIEKGCTPHWVELSRTPSGIYILTLQADGNPENRWIAPFTLAVHKAFDAVEWHLENEAGETPAALLTVSESAKFFSNGIDPDGRYSQSLKLPDMTHAELVEARALSMPGFIRPLQLPIPTIAAINGHAFGAGLMFAAAHDYRLQREDKGFMCAVEVEIGVGIPPPEMALFRHIMSDPAWYDTVMGAKRWGATESLKEGIVSKVSSGSLLFADSLALAEHHARFAHGEGGRLLYMSIKNQAKGHVNHAVMDYCFPHGNVPPQMAAVPEVATGFKSKYPYLWRHVGEKIDPLPGGDIMGALKFRAKHAKAAKL